MRFDEYVEIMGESWDIDIHDITGITRKGNDYHFSVDEDNYMVKMTHFNQNNWSMKFGVTEDGIKIKDIDMVKGKSISQVKDIMSNVGKSTAMFIRYRNPNSIRYDADRPSRQKSYLRLVNMLMNKKEMFGYRLEPYNSTIYYVIKNELTLKDILN